MWGIVIHEVVRGLQGARPCGRCSHVMGFSLFFLLFVLKVLIVNIMMGVVGAVLGLDISACTLFLR